jgi:hypothetical protein
MMVEKRLSLFDPFEKSQGKKRLYLEESLLFESYSGDLKQKITMT